MPPSPGKRRSVIPFLVVLIVGLIVICRIDPTLLSRLVKPPTPVPFVLPPVHQPPEILKPDGWMHADFSEKEYVSVHFIGIFNGCFMYKAIMGVDMKVPEKGGCLDENGGYTEMYARRNYAIEDPVKQIIYGVWARKANDGSNRVEVFFTLNMKR